MSSLRYGETFRKFNLNFRTPDFLKGETDIDTPVIDISDCKYFIKI